MAFTPTSHDLAAIQTYREVLQSASTTSPEYIWTIDERLKTLYKKEQKLTHKTKRYAEQLRYVLCEVEPKTCPFVIDQSL